MTGGAVAGRSFLIQRHLWIATDTVQYVATNPTGQTSTIMRTVIIGQLALPQ
jgi:hypothetical protein